MKRTFVEKEYHICSDPVINGVMKLQWYKQLRDVVVDSIKVTLSKNVNATLTIYKGKEIDFVVPINKRVAEFHINRPTESTVEYKIEYSDDLADAEVIMTLSGDMK